MIGKSSAKFIVISICFILPSLSFGRNKRDWKYSLELQVSRCYNMRNVSIKCDHYFDKNKKFGELQITAIDRNGEKFWYGYQKFLEGNICWEHLRAIQRLTKSADQACISGWGEMKIDDETIVHWSGFETKHGSYYW